MTRARPAALRTSTARPASCATPRSWARPEASTGDLARHSPRPPRPTSDFESVRVFLQSGQVCAGTGMLRDMAETNVITDRLSSLFDEPPAVEEQQVIAAKQARAASRRQPAAVAAAQPRADRNCAPRTWVAAGVRITGARLVWGYVRAAGPEPFDRIGQGPWQQRRTVGDRPADPVRAVAVRHARCGGRRPGDRRLTRGTPTAGSAAACR